MRASGILMHITSLPGPYGVGTMGKKAYEFVDFLKASGQSRWQLLPLTPTGYGDSPYQSCSTFAGNHYLIDLDLLIGEGLLKAQEVQNIQWNTTEDRVDFGLLYRNRLPVLRIAYGRFEDDKALDDFCRENSDWLPDFALYMALKEQQGGKAWYQWPEELKRRDPDAMWNSRRELKEQIRFYSFVQYLFFGQWKKLKQYANDAGIRIIGDVPIYVPLDSVDVWGAPELFQLDQDLNPEAVAGCPPDAFTEDGQLWGNPLYRWEEHKKDGYSWWLRRLAAAGKLFDVIRLDHFRGFEAYWSVPYGDKTARYGHWVKGPDMDFIATVQKELPHIDLIAEDLGFLTPEVLKLRDDAHLPGMKIMEFAFDPNEPSEYVPYSLVPNAVCYTGTHDNSPVLEWMETTSEGSLQLAMDYMDIQDKSQLVWGMIRTAMATVCDLCVVQLQDYLELGGEARMNCPGIQSGSNWTWRVQDGKLTEELAKRIYKLTRLYGRLPSAK